MVTEHHTKKIAILGCGNMGGAIARGMQRAKLNFQYFCYTPEHDQAEALAAEIGGVCTHDLAALPPCDFYLIACKPQQHKDLAAALMPNLHKDAHLISIMAGIGLAKLRAIYPNANSITRVMPNLPCQVGLGAAGIVFEKTTDETIREQVRNIFRATSLVIDIADDALMHAVGATVGSGPGYFFEFARVLTNATIAFGIPEADAKKMITQLFVGSAEFLAKSGQTPEELRNRVSSKGGITAKALEVLQNANFEGLLTNMLAAAVKRSEELGAEY